MQRAKPLTDKVMQRAKPLTDKVNGAVASVTTPAARRVRAGKDSAVQTLCDGRQMVHVKVNNVFMRLHVIEVKDWSLEKSNNFKSSTLSEFDKFRISTSSSFSLWLQCCLHASIVRWR